MIFVIEPHSDDAMISMGGHIERWVSTGKPVTIVTVYSQKTTRGKEAEQYATAVGARWLGLGFMESGGGMKCVPKVIPTTAAFEYIRNRFLPTVQDRAIIPVASFAHPEHGVVRHVVEECELNQCQLQYYLDMPYAIVRANGENVNAALQEMNIVSFLKPLSRKWRHVGLFKSQAKYFHFNPVEKLKECFELILEKR